MTVVPFGYTFPPELWTKPLTGTELIRIDVGSAFETFVTTAQLLAGSGGAGGIGAALAASPSYANDAAAAAGGVPLTALYRNGNFVMVRLT